MLTTVLLVVGCSKRGPSAKIASSAFDSAPPEVKQLWSEGLNAWKGHHYQEAATSLKSLQDKATSLSPQQTEELNQACDEFGRETFAAANKGDPGATQAVLTMRGASRGRAGNTQ